MSWISTKDKLPDVDYSDPWNAQHMIAKRCMTYSKEWGIRFGQYFGQAEHWNVDGVSSSRGIEVTHWQPLPELPK